MRVAQASVSDHNCKRYFEGFCWSDGQIIRRLESASKSNENDSSIEQVAGLVSRREKKRYMWVHVLNWGPLSFVVSDSLLKCTNTNTENTNQASK